MPPDPKPLEYRPGNESTRDEAPAGARSAGTWAILSGVWALGLLVWLLYLALIALIVIRLFG
jgi:hypothetical protein